MPKKPKKASMYDELRDLIADVVQASVDNSWSGSGHPEDVAILKAELDLAHLKLERHLNKMESNDV